MTWAALVILLMAVGLVLLAIEFFAPGISVPGIAGAGLILSAAILGWTKLGPIWGLTAFFSGIAFTIFGVWLLPKTSVGRHMVLDTAQRSKAMDDLSELIGKTGVALTPLRPSGKVEIENRPIDVVTDGVYLDSGARVRVSRVEGPRVVVDVVDVVN